MSLHPYRLFSHLFSNTLAITQSVFKLLVRGSDRAFALGFLIVGSYFLICLCVFTAGLAPCSGSNMPGLPVSSSQLGTAVFTRCLKRTCSRGFIGLPLLGRWRSS